MRIAIVHWTRRKVGGTETYLGKMIPGLQGAGQVVGFWHEVDQPTDRDLIELSPEAPTWSVADLGRETALRALRDWHPDVIFAHGFTDPGLESEVLRIAPAILFAHGYSGTCISGAKTFKTPVVTPCHRRFGLQCLLHYYPHRCGGLSPLTMLRQYRYHGKRLRLMRHYQAVLTASDHMRDEYIRHGLAPGRVRKVALPVGDQRSVFPAEWAGPDNPAGGTRKGDPWRLLFLGRMDYLKGGRTFLEALPLIRARLCQPLRVTFAGDGPDRTHWEEQAGQVCARHPGIEIDFAGWTSGGDLDRLFDACDLLVVPSLWPEPFGLVGPEAGLRGVPAAAFAVGGIPDWLTNGVNGHLAPGDPPTAAGLAEAIVRCLGEPTSYARLRRGAVELAQRFTMNRHLNALLAVFSEAALLDPSNRTTHENRLCRS